MGLIVIFQVHGNFRFWLEIFKKSWKGLYTCPDWIEANLGYVIKFSNEEKFWHRPHSLRNAKVNLFTPEFSHFGFSTKIEFPTKFICQERLKNIILKIV